MLSFYVVIEMYNRVSQKNRAVAFLLISPLNPVSVGIEKWKVLWGGAIMAPPLKSSRMMLQRHVRGQHRGSWVCPVHPDYFQLADMCISRVFTWF